ncbi:MBL fold metallo-hydrolase [Planctobacterium marinum]|uniref:MBL fold metallo-hydrolase n=1 Tax=Planctobacterium marinum TaxID=1631968 RepID=UPI001E50836C|nr:MBL fold metallo-hydrolase [Planctobacterium marinum]MCC2605868.1 MBL fold metallo-hydrolase [Planctobacterium marinum]
MPMVKFWGTRGSIPVAPHAHNIRARLEDILIKAVDKQLTSYDDIAPFLDSLSFPEVGSFGGNTSCVEIDTGKGDYLLCDMGTGLRDFAAHYLRDPKQQRSKTFHLLLSHLHWDHIMGFPFFTPAYIPGHKIHIYGCHEQLESAIRAQHSGPGFPVSFDTLLADIEFHLFNPGEKHHINGIEVEAFLQVHEGNSYGYRFQVDDKKIVYSTDSEHKVEDQARLDRFVRFIQNADLVIFDAMYSLLEAVTLKEDWGHSSNLMGVELCLRAAAKKLCLFHHDPVHSDEEIQQNLDEAENFAALIAQSHQPSLEVIAAWDGLQVEV